MFVMVLEKLKGQLADLWDDLSSILKVLGPVGVSVSFGILLVAGNYVMGVWQNWPFLYCYLADPIGQVYLDWGSVVLYFLAVCFLVALWKVLVIHTLMIGGLIFAVIELPNLVRHLFFVGGSCG